MIILGGRGLLLRALWWTSAAELLCIAEVEWGGGEVAAGAMNCRLFGGGGWLDGKRELPKLLFALTS